MSTFSLWLIIAILYLITGVTILAFGYCVDKHNELPNTLYFKVFTVLLWPLALFFAALILFFFAALRLFFAAIDIFVHKITEHTSELYCSACHQQWTATYSSLDDELPCPSCGFPVSIEL